MRHGPAGQRFKKWCMAVMLLLVVLVMGGTADAFTLKVVTPVRDATTQVVTGYTPIDVGFRWLLEEDNTVDIKPGIPVVDPASVQIHNSYASVVKSGESNDATVTIPAAGQKRYFVSVLPTSGFTQSGAMVSPGQNTVTVIVSPMPVPTAQISVFVFNDNNPVNAGPDLTEVGLAGFNVLMFDQLGQVSKDAFNNPLGTEYQKNPDGSFILDPDGAPVIQTLGTGVLTSGADGFVNIKYINPGKYGIRAAPPIGTTWVQTNTIEGTVGIDAWVKADEPTLLIEFGPAFTHIFLGFVNLTTDPANPDALPWIKTPPGPAPPPIQPPPPPPPAIAPPPLPQLFNATITGRMISNHIDGPPGAAANAGLAVPECYVALNDTTAVGEATKIAAACNPDSTFTFTNVPPGTYNLVTWDKSLDYIFNFTTVVNASIAANSIIDLGDVIMQPWFGNYAGSVFRDENENGFREPGELGIPDQAINLRFRDGSIYAGTATDPNGNFSMNEVFPWFRWLVAEVDYARYKATGATNIIDAGGQLFGADNITPVGDAALIYPGTGTSYASMGIRPQIQADGQPYRSDTGVVLTKALFTFAGMTNRIDWGKKEYTGDDKGDLTGIVYYATTRAENDPQMAAADPWEPGIARVQVNLYTDYDGDGKIDDRNGNGKIDPADADNDPQGNFPGPEDIDRNHNGVFNWGDAVSVVYTDNWDDNKPTGCIQALPVIHGQQPQPCYDGFFTWNQVQPEVFNGGYAFTEFFPDGPKSTPVFPLPTGQYIVEGVVPRGYDLVKEEDRNVDFGDAPIPSPLLLPPACVGELHDVPQFLDLFPDTPVDPAFALTKRPLCDRKLVSVVPGRNSAADFFIFTKTPKAARAVGMITNDLAAAFAPTDPAFGEKAAPAWLPISYRDWAGNELVRTYSDEFGGYNALLPSTFTVNAPIPTGVSPHMITICLNHPGPIPDPNNPKNKILDPFFNPNFSQTCYTLDFWPAKTTYLDTPVLPLSAFASGIAIVDVQPDAGTPVIASVEGIQGGAITCKDNEVITIKSMGTQRVANPSYDPTILNSSPLITRDFGFGNTKGIVTLNGIELTIVSWNKGVIKAKVPISLAPGGELLVTRGDNGLATRIGLNLHVDAGGCVAGIVRVNQNPGTGEFGTIQEGIDAAPAGALVLVEPGIYFENPVIWKNVRLQGSGAGQTIINANPQFPFARTPQWQDYVTNIVNTTPGVLLTGPTALTSQTLLTVTQIDSTPGILVLVPDGVFSQASPGLIDGFTVRGATNGGAILVNGYADYMEISNNKIANSLGAHSGGVRVGFLGANGSNDNVYIHHNEIISNSSFNLGGGIALFDGSHNYRITDNVISGNVGRNGGGITHEGLSNNGLIARNKIAFNEVFSDQLILGSGGGIYITGGTTTVNDPVTGLPVLVGTGAGNVTIDANLIQGNLAGAGQGGGIRAVLVNFKDLQDNPGNPAAWYSLNIFNNMIVNNVATDAGGAIALKQAAKVNIVNNTIAHNDSVATALVTFPVGNLTESTPQPAGIVSTANNEAYATLTGGQLFPNPLLVDNIIFQNRSFFWKNPAANNLPGLLPAPQHSSGIFGSAAYWDLEVITAPDAWIQNPVDLNALKLNPDHSILTSLTGPFGDDFSGNGNITLNPEFVKPYVNELVTGQSADEAGNNINVYYRPLTLNSGDYHIANTSPAVDAGIAVAGFPQLATDFDGNLRPNPDTGGIDIGADELMTLSDKVTVVRPNGGEVIPTGSAFEITWTAPLEATQFNLFFSSNNGASWTQINKGGKVTGRSFTWTAPTTPGNKAKSLIRVDGFDANGKKVGTDRSNQPFTVEVIRLDSPNGGAVWTSGTTQTVFWTTGETKKPATKVKILFSGNGGASWQTLKTLTGADIDPTSGTSYATPGEHSTPINLADYKVTTVKKPKTRCLFRVDLIGAGGRLGSDKSNGFFTILPNPVQ